MEEEIRVPESGDFQEQQNYHQGIADVYTVHLGKLQELLQKIHSHAGSELRPHFETMLDNVTRHFTRRVDIHTNLQEYLKGSLRTFTEKDQRDSQIS